MAAKLVVTGSSGHIGYHVAQRLLQRGYEVHLLLRQRNVLTQRLTRRGAVEHIVDLQQSETYSEVLAGAEGLFHLAASNTTSQSDAANTRRSTAELTQVAISAAVAAKIPKIIYTSSVVVLGRSADPQRLIREDDRTDTAESPYVRGKIEAEEFCRQQNEAGADIRIVYPSWVVGPDDPKCTPPHKLVRDFVAKGQRFYFDGGISIAHVADVAAAHVAAFERGAPRGRYVLGGSNISFREFYELLAKLSGRKPPGLKFSKRVMLMLARAAKAIFRTLGAEPPVDPTYVEAIVGNYSWYDSRKAMAELDYKIRPAEVSLTDSVLGARMRLAGTYELGLKTAEADYAADPAGELLLVTGVPGWLGNRLVDVLVNGDAWGKTYAPRRVRLFVHPGAREVLRVPASFEIVYGDINDTAAVAQAVAGATTVFHFAGAIWPPKTETLYRVNAQGTKTLVDACLAAGVRRVLFMSTDSTCGHGTTEQRVFDEQTPAKPYRDYGTSKREAELHLLVAAAAGRLDVTILRGFWFFGPYAPERQLGFIRMFSWPRQLVFGNGKNLRSISHIDNVVDAFLKAEKNTATYGKWYWIGDEEGGRSVDAIYQTVADTLGRPFRPFHVPVFACRMLNVVDLVLSKLGRIQPTIYSAGKFHFDIAGRSDAATRDFDYAARATLGDAVREMNRMASEQC